MADLASAFIGAVPKPQPNPGPEDRALWYLQKIGRFGADATAGAIDATNRFIANPIANDIKYATGTDLWGYDPFRADLADTAANAVSGAAEKAGVPHIPDEAMAGTDILGSKLGETFANALDPGLLAPKMGMLMGATSNLWSKEALKRAEDVAKQGGTVKEIWQAGSQHPVAGTMFTAQGPKQEISDSAMTLLRLPKPGETLPLKQVINHPLGYAAYGDKLRNLNVHGKAAGSMPGAAGSYGAGIPLFTQPSIKLPERSASQIAALPTENVVLHEGVHGVQDIEKWLSQLDPTDPTKAGTAAETISKQTLADMFNIKDTGDLLAHPFYKKLANNFTDFQKIRTQAFISPKDGENLKKLIDRWAGQQGYKREINEVEALTTEQRMKMGFDELLANPWPEHSSVPFADIIVQAKK